MIRFLLALVLMLPVAVQADTRIPASKSEISMSFAPLVKQAAPAVVNIYASRVVEQRSPFADDPFFGNFFRDFAAPRPRVQNSLGSGVILSPDGIMVSNYHVVGQATDIRVVLNTREEFAARVLLADEESDIAILKLDGARDMPFLRFRDSDTVEVGELVLAIGNPFGVGQTVSSGIVSGLARSGTATGNARGYFIQTDAPINPGNSGGALIDINGDLIGVNTSILTRSGGSNGIGFAIPSALVEQFVKQATSGEQRFQRPWAGLTGQSVDADISESLGRAAPQGILISAIHPASPFLEAGLRVGDVILQVDRQPVNTPAEMIYRMSVKGIGETARVQIARQGKTKALKVKLIAPPDSPARNTKTLGGTDVLPGLTVARINPAVIEELGLPVNSEGIVVLDPGRWGARAGLRAGDIITEINGRVIERPAQVARALAKAAPRIAITAIRGSQRIQLRFRA